MSAYLILRLEAPLMSFGAVCVDETNPTRAFPGLSMLTGLLGNALGLDHSEAEKLSDLQRHLEFAARVDVEGTRLVDYQTVDLGQEFMLGGWTTWGRAEGRGGAKSAAEGTHQRWRHYWADRVVTIAVGVRQGARTSLDQIREALRTPARTLWFGRKTCLPSGPILRASIEAESLLAALEGYPLSARAESQQVAAQWPSCEPKRDAARLVHVSDERDWRNQIHVGRRQVHEGRIAVKKSAKGEPQ